MRSERERGSPGELARGLGALLALGLGLLLGSVAVALVWSLAEFWRALFGWS